MEPAINYREILSLLRSEGFEPVDIDAAIIHLIDNGITYAEEDHTYLTADEVQAARDWLTKQTD